MDTFAMMGQLMGWLGVDELELQNVEPGLVELMAAGRSLAAAPGVAEVVALAHQIEALHRQAKEDQQ